MNLTSKWWGVLIVVFLLRFGSMVGYHTLSIFHEGFHYIVASTQGQSPTIVSAGRTRLQDENRMVLLAGYYGEMYVFGALAFFTLHSIIGAFSLGIFLEIFLEAGGSSDFAKTSPGAFYMIWFCIALAIVIKFVVKKKAPN